MGCTCSQSQEDKTKTETEEDADSLLLSEGMFAKCYKEKLTVFKKEGLRYGVFEDEVQFLRDLQGHENILKLFCWTKDNFIAEFLPFTFEKLEPDRLTPDMVRVVYTGIRAALEHCHENRIVYCDVAPANIGTRNPDIHNMSVSDIVLFDFDHCQTGEMVDGVPTGMKWNIGRHEYCAFRLQLHMGARVQPRDDLESLFYTCRKLEMGWLPWGEDESEEDEIANRKHGLLVQFHTTNFKDTALSLCEVFSPPSVTP